MRFLFIPCRGTHGDINPFLTVTRWLKSNGHWVGWLLWPTRGGPKDEAWIEAAGGEVLAIPEPWYTAMPSTAVPGIAHMLAGIDDQLARVDAIRALLRSCRPDVVAHDSNLQLLAPVLASCLENLRYAVIAPNLTQLSPGGDNPILTEEMRGWRAQVAEFVHRRFAERGQSVQLRSGYGRCGQRVISPWLNTAYTTREYVGDVELPPQTYLVGPCVPPGGFVMSDNGFPWNRLDAGKRLVYLSFGTHSANERLYGILAEAAVPLDVQLVVATGILPDHFCKSLPGTVLSVGYAPQLALLARAQAFISCGGANSVMESMYFGVPLLVIPLVTDQWLPGYFFGRAGDRAPGISLEAGDCTVARAREMLARLLDDERYRANAARIRASYVAQDGGKGAAEHLERLANTAR